MDAFLDKELKNMEHSLLAAYELAAKYGDETQKDKSLFLKQFEELGNIRKEAQRCERALEVARAESTVDAVKTKYKQQLEETSQTNSRQRNAKTKDYLVFESKINEIADAANANSACNQAPTTSRVECDEYVMESEINTIDPLTKLPMTDPVRNKLCGHHYENSSINEAISLNKRLRCPVAGCGNKQFVRDIHLEKDMHMKMRLQALAAKRQQEEDSD